MADPKLRVVNYNVAKLIGDTDSMKETINKTREDKDSVVGAFVFQEVTQDNLRILQGMVGSDYSLGTFTDSGDSEHGGAQAIFYKRDMFRERSRLHSDIYTGAGRRGDRWTLRSKADGEDLVIYGAHLKAFPDEEDKRNQGVMAIREDMKMLAPNTRTIVAGDMNFYSTDEPGYKGFVDMGLSPAKPAPSVTKTEDPLFDPDLAKKIKEVQGFQGVLP